ncbi:MAG: ubiquinol-cytochrome C chaperone family protein [Alphaproteobacteria bacterium]|nr:ubiquinol-cytochrome C chaperone family protein [Alphaproteobacteria bacterium]
MVSAIFGLPFRRAGLAGAAKFPSLHRRRQTRKILHALVHQSLLPRYYLQGSSAASATVESNAPEHALEHEEGVADFVGVSDSFAGRFDLLSLHVALVLVALGNQVGDNSSSSETMDAGDGGEGAGAGNALSGRVLVECFVSNMDLGFRNAGLGDLRVGGKVRGSVAALRATAGAWRVYLASMNLAVGGSAGAVGGTDGGGNNHDHGGDHHNACHRDREASDSWASSLSEEAAATLYSSSLFGEADRRGGFSSEELRRLRHLHGVLLVFYGDVRRILAMNHSLDALIVAFEGMVPPASADLR